MHSTSALSEDVRSLTEGWELCITAPGAALEPGALPANGFVPAVVPGTVATALKAIGTWSFDQPRDFDAEDVWYRCRFPRPRAPEGARVRLCFDGLATLSDIFLNGERLLTTDNMFVRHVADITDALRDTNELAIRFRALAPELKLRKVRPRWRTKLVEQQQLRWVRTTLLGRMPGWCPPVAPVGPFRAVRLEIVERGLVRARHVHSRMDGTSGVVAVRVELTSLGSRAIESARAVVGDREKPLVQTTSSEGVVELSGEIRVPDAPLWWPHTHGPQPLSAAALVVRFDDGVEVRYALGRVGFRTLTLDTSNDGFAILVNGVRVFARGACWTPLDVSSLSATVAEYRSALELARDAGMNMVRIGGTMLYEEDAFYDACDELGILVWQDFMFANMDYPATDETFVASVRREATELLGRLQHRPSTAIFCGNSEVEQQAAMLGLPRDIWRNELFASVLREIVEQWAPGAPYWPSSPSGGSMPFQVSSGVSHYYGVGAYERPFDDARRSNVRFTAECLAFANVPERATLDRLTPDGAPPVHHPAWKARVPRDRGAGWDFDDVRDHYMEALFGAASRNVRYGDQERYLELARVTTGEVMQRVFAEWRRPGSNCNGGLVWFFRDLWPGAGWGVVDSTGAPKAAYWYLRRVLAPETVLFSDEGLDGLVVHALNDRERAIDVQIRTNLYRLGETRVAEGQVAATLPAHGSASFPLQALLETFIDTTYAYRFGPPSHDLIVATMTNARSGDSLGTAFYFPLGFSAARESDVGLDALAESVGPSEFVVTVSTKRFAEAVSLEIRGGVPSDDYFHLAPGARHRIFVRMVSPDTPLHGTVRALNAYATAKIRTENSAK